MVQEIALEGSGRWFVVFKDNNRWQCGIYVPEYFSKDEVAYIEKHDGPELFYLVDGKVVLVLSADGKNFVEVPMKKGIIYIVDEWHNAYRPNGSKGIVLVIEKTNIKTEFLNICD
ncbi:MAG: hypothetical protein QXY76_07820 [Nitrososphaeria archaeon]